MLKITLRDKRINADTRKSPVNNIVEWVKKKLRNKVKKKWKRKNEGRRGDSVQRMVEDRLARIFKNEKSSGKRPRGKPSNAENRQVIGDDF